MTNTKEKAKKVVGSIKTTFMIIWVIAVVVGYWILLPAINLSSVGFWAFFLPAVIIPAIVLTQAVSLKGGFKKGKALWPIFVAAGAVAIYILGDIAFSPMFNAKNYTKRIEIQTSSFENDVEEVDFNNLPLLDKTSSQKVGDRVVGQISSLVSQFCVSDEYTLINYKGEIVRVTPLEHNGLFKYFANQEGTAGYVIVDTTTGEAKLVQTKEGLKYLPSSYFLKNLTRHVRFAYPFENLGETSFEIDENGNPYWIIQTIDYTWVGLKPTVSGIIVVNAINGETQKYTVSEVPTWIDNVYDASLVISEIDSWGLYQNGYVNSMFAQKNVVQTTDGYTYLVKNDDVYMYTGITSVSNDESNIGFVLVNLRTHQASFYEVPGAEEYSAMDSAIGLVPEKNYSSTFPLLINLAGKPTYLLSLKDDAGLVKMYSFVDIQDYQKVSVSDASLGIEAAAEEYLKLFDKSVKKEDITEGHIVTIQHLNEVVVDGNTYYYFLDNEGNKYSLKASVDLSITPFMQNDDQYVVNYYEKDGIRVVNKISQ